MKIKLTTRGIILRGGRILLGKRHKLDDHKSDGLWQLPGGKQKPNETPAEAVAREIREETGLTIKLSNTVPAAIYRQNPGHNEVMFIFSCRIKKGSLLKKGPEHNAWKWIAPAHYKKLKCTPGTKLALQWWLASK